MIKTIQLDDLISEARNNPSLRRTSGTHWQTNEYVECVSFKQAIERAATGDDSLVPAAERVIEDLNLTGFETRGRDWQMDVAGAYPLVPEFLMNRPDCMRSLVFQESDTMPVRLVVDLFASCTFSGELLRNRGTVILALLMMLQRFRPVELQLLTSSTNGSRSNAMGLLIPIHTKPVNLSVAAFLFSPAFFRLLTFSYMEVVMGVPGSIPNDSNHLCKAELNLGPDDIYVEPAIGYEHETGAILGNPKKWLQDQLDRILGREDH